MNKIEINNLSGFEIDKKKVREILNLILKSRDLSEKEISLAFLKKDEIRELNRRCRGIDKATDVLSFEGENNFLGEAVISPEIVAGRKKEGESFYFALTHILSHSVLHLTGFDHKNKKERIFMRSEENKILEKIKNKVNKL
ncbi:MAG: rRNA maturation RNase YbeY [bacterium]